MNGIGRIKQLKERRFLRAAQFAAAASIGFFVAEGVIIVGLYAIFRRADVPSSYSSSPVLVALDVFALVVGVTVSFLLNERWASRHAAAEVRRRTMAKTLVRLVKFQGVSALGNAVVIVVQLALLSLIGTSPAVGNVIGAIAAFPVSYLVSMRVVWTF